MFAELQNIKLNDMTLLHQDDLHFNLIVNKNSNLATLGSLSYRFNVGPIIKEENKMDQRIINEEEQDEVVISEEKSDDDSLNDLNNVKKELKKSENGRKYIGSEYFKCEKELRSKTEENEKLKTEIKDLKQIISLSKDLKDAGASVADKNILGQSKKDEGTSDHTSGNNCDSKVTEEADNPWKKINRKPYHSTPKRKVIEEEEFNCYKCDFQGNTKAVLSKHISLKHVRRVVLNENLIECKYCGKQFNSKSEFMHHRKNDHSGTVAYCRNNVVGKCPFADDACWWRHDNEVTASDNISCFICDKTFNTKSEMMKHRKRDHKQIVKVCEKFKEQLCRYKSDSCWYSHEEEVDKNESGKEERVNNSQSVFQKSSQDLKPPFQNVQKKQKME